LKSYGIPASRLKIFHGEAGNRPAREFWVLPKNKSLPLPEAAPDRLGKEAALIREYFEYQLDSMEDQELAFKGFVDLLKEYPSAKLCFMIMPSFPEDREVGTTNKSNKFVSPKVDFHAIVKRWQMKFISRLKINPNRIVIMSPTGVHENFYGKMHAWIVPANAELPAPPKVDGAAPIYQRQ
jgi:hypothetical protein